MIRTAEHEYYEIPEIPLAERPAALHPHLAMRPRPAERPTRTASGAGVVAYVNWSRWVADCPTEGCYGALVVSAEDPRFYCPYCFNEPAGNQYLAVSFPDAATRDAIAEQLLARPFEANRNWLPHESVADLAAENDAHAVEIAAGVDGLV